MAGVETVRIGLISDTHGLLRSEALAALRGCDQIIHAGDIGDPGIVSILSTLAPTTAVRGNNDKGDWAAALRDTEVVEIAGKCLYVLHDLAELDLLPAAAGFHIVVSSHSHQPHIEHREGVLYVNPGSAGPRRFKLPIALAEIRIAPPGINARIIEIAASVPFPKFVE